MAHAGFGKRTIATYGPMFRKQPWRSKPDIFIVKPSHRTPRRST